MELTNFIIIYMLMARYLGPKIKVIRRLGELPGLTQKISKRQSENDQRRKLSQYALRLREKQKLRFNYGISEKQLLSYVKKARRLPGSTGTLLIRLLEMRIDTLIFRLCIAPSMASCRQLVTHGQISVNNQKVTIPSYQCKINDIIKFDIPTNAASPLSVNKPTSSHLNRSATDPSAQICSFPDRQALDLDVNELRVIEYYSR